MYINIENSPHGRIVKQYFTRFTPWYSKYNCSTTFRHEICVLPVNDLPFVFSLNQFVLNKILMDQQSVLHQCLEEFYEYKVKNKPIINYDVYCTVLKKHSKISLC